ncbi:Uncharacterised protein [Acidipropionibacterium jensenii]|uniref:Uncharacterized protein n=1 Tax=Acidipropionibacterium jensenii TaxID=1749 RepID=A0A448P1H1_9ACTN|nr:Uncharacterised protein [Acidipropionibacterium jensenii]
MNWKNWVPVIWLNLVAPSCITTASTMVGVEISSMQISETIRSLQWYCRTADQAPTATPPTREMIVPIVTSLTETPMRVAMRALMASPRGVQPQFQCRKTISSQRP